MPVKDQTFLQKNFLEICAGRKEKITVSMPLKNHLKHASWYKPQQSNLLAGWKKPNSCDIEEEEKVAHAWGKSSDYLIILYMFKIYGVD